MAIANRAATVESLRRLSKNLAAYLLCGDLDDGSVGFSNLGRSAHSFPPIVFEDAQFRVWIERHA